MRVRWRLVPPVVVLVAAACDVPKRDNIHDPVNAPTVQARVIDYTGPGGTCMPLVVGSTYTVVAAAPRGHCLAIDARATTDPQGTALADLEFTFALLGTAGETEIVAQGPFGPLPVETRALLSIGALTSFRVRAEDPRGSRGVATIPFVALNVPPIAAVTSARREIPLHGFPWIGSDQPVPLRFSSGASTDADFDLMRAYWTWEGATTEAPVLDVSIATTSPQRRVVSLVVRDPSSESERAFGSVRVAPPRPWVMADRDTFVHSRLDLELSELQVTPATGFFSEAFVAPGNPPLLGIVRNNGQDVDLGEYPIDSLATVLAPQPSFVFDSCRPPSLVYDRARGRLWAAGSTDSTCFNSPGGRIASLVVDTDGGLSFTPDVDLVVPGLDLHGAEIDAAGNLWTGGTGPGGHQIIALKPDLTLSVYQTPLSSEVILARRPDTSEMWVHPYGYGGKLLIFEGLPEEEPTEIDAPPYFTGPAFVDSARVWFFTPYTGLALFDAAVLKAGLPFEDAIIAAFPEILDAQYMKVDRQTGDVWTAQLGGVGSTLHRASPDGTRAETNLGYGQFVGLDPNGMPLVLEVAGEFRRTETPFAANGLSVSLQVPASPLGNRDPLTGGLWVLRTFPYELWHFGPDATLLQRVIEIDGEPLPALSDLQLSHDGRRAWAFSQDESFQYGVSMFVLDEDGVQEMRTVLDPPAGGELMFNSRVGIQPTRSSFAYGVRRDLGDFRFRVRTVTTDGGGSDVFTLPDGEIDTFFSNTTWADTWSDDSLCLASAVYPVENQGDALHMWRVTPAGETDLGIVDIASSSGLLEVFVSTTEENGNLLCWVLAGTDGSAMVRVVTLFAIDLTGTVVHRMDIGSPPPGRLPTSLYAIDDDVVYFGERAAPSLGGDPRSTLHLVTFSPVPAAPTATDGHVVFTYPGTGDGPFLHGR